MKPLTRRSVTTGLAAAVTVIPAVGLCASLKSDADARVKHHTRELEKAMHDLYGVDCQVFIWDEAHGRPAIIVVALT